VNLDLAQLDEALDEIAQTEFLEIDGGSCVGHVLRPAMRAASLQVLCKVPIPVRQAASRQSMGARRRWTAGSPLRAALKRDEWIIRNDYATRPRAPAVVDRRARMAQTRSRTNR
jgi:hypothetical protein